MSYQTLPLARVLKESLIGWELDAAGALVLLVVVTVAFSERGRRRRLERALAVARQVPLFRKEPVALPSRPDIEAHHARHRYWLFPLVAIVLGLIVGVWSIWNVLTS